MIGRFGRARIGAHRRRELEAVLAGHLDVGDDDVEAAAALQQRERLVDRRRRRDRVAGGLEHRRQHVAEERRVVDQQDAGAAPRRPEMPPVQPILERQRQVMRDVDDLGRLPLDDRASP